MTLYELAAFTGNYSAAPPAELEQAKIVTAHEFGAPAQGNGPGRINEALARKIAEEYGDHDLYVAETIAEPLSRIDGGIKPKGVFIGSSANLTASVGGTWSELQQAKRMINEIGAKVIILGQAYHAPRIKRQAEKIGFEALLPSGLPKQFDPESSQKWCRGPIRWARRELPGRPALRFRGQL